ncbi:thiamine biosynthesis protein ThiS [Candidatus Marinamargulisbacteria bacterium SCGC AG-343-D04]|nr:thiamine biosynthesis protein ThiS [Candidatus Marinamargulisbacteria bacterium SCGC AG-343-D04]
MKLTINGEAAEFEEASFSVSELLKRKDVKMPDMVSVEYNGDMLDRENFDSTMVKDGDQLEFLYFMGGGQ